jgi:hypothetical protein
MAGAPCSSSVASMSDPSLTPARVRKAPDQCCPRQVAARRSVQQDTLTNTVAAAPTFQAASVITSSASRRKGVDFELNDTHSGSRPKTAVPSQCRNPLNEFEADARTQEDAVEPRHPLCKRRAASVRMARLSTSCSGARCHIVAPTTLLLGQMGHDGHRQRCHSAVSARSQVNRFMTTAGSTHPTRRSPNQVRLSRPPNDVVEHPGRVQDPG